MVAAHLLLLVLFSSSLVYADDEGGSSESSEGSSSESSEEDSGELLGLMVDLMADVLGLLELDLDVDLGLGGGGGGSGDEEGSCGEDGGECIDVETCDRNLNDNFCEQPIFVKFLTRNERSCLIDNICYTYFPLPDDPYTFNQYKSTVFLDGSFIIETSVTTDIELGRTRAANPQCTSVNNYIGYAGCDTFVVYRCNEYGECASRSEVSVMGLSVSPLPLGVACIEKVKDIMDCKLGESPDIVLLPQQLPCKCVTEQLCINSIKGNFYRALNLPVPSVPAVVLA